MMQTSGDILNLSISLAVLAIAVFLCWSLYYLIASLRKINKISNQAKKIGDKIENLVNLTKSRVKQSGSYFFILTKLADRAIDYFNKKSQDKEDKEEETVKNKKSKNNK
ncbi:hypothetical protein CVU82_00090 [Candidatus Falkowbacteria bacterium HGW-Falkowbacteria-1]|uniref:Uncharacterized protein n=1 Tax=Candidatus Falkowbacteria bacterium HGW-Falkowbacteria-1 TaxID=2013768 RepID=A0A2N2EAA3_9BACT|nr:MAG: hypothetical protein CVU82_00090 [Candidatus Falkowbacteria bacterium HGW-Falkowbacteria-1]